MSRKGLLPILFVASLGFVCLLHAQEGGGLQQHVAQLKESMAKNKQALAQYTWFETVTISLKGQEKKQQHFQVQAAYAKANISMTPGPGGVKLVIHNYVKPDDSMTLTIDKEQKQLQSIQIASYMDAPSDGMNLTVRFDRLPDGTNHVSSTMIEGVSKQLTVATQNANYQKR